MKTSTDRFAADQQEEIAALKQLPDDQIDTTEVPEMRDWSTAQRGALYRPVKQQITLHLDADIVAWFKSHARGRRGYQTGINRALRSHVRRSRR
ncbi:MAG: BrnA antitoxin family protein [Spirochaetaceae bacterium]|nr:BrnA antitoxin family protein [Spirochaetaceae bacterium]